jgi:hypothetical protein
VRRRDNGLRAAANARDSIVPVRAGVTNQQASPSSINLDADARVACRVKRPRSNTTLQAPAHTDGRAATGRPA